MNKRFITELGLLRFLPVQLKANYGFFDRADSTSKFFSGNRLETLEKIALNMRKNTEARTFNPTSSVIPDGTRTIPPLTGSMDALFGPAENDKKPMSKKWLNSWVKCVLAADESKVKDKDAFVVNPMEIDPEEVGLILHILDNTEAYFAAKVKKPTKEIVDFGAVKVDLAKLYERKGQKKKSNPRNINSDLFTVSPSASSTIDRINAILGKADAPQCITALFYGLPGTGKTELGIEMANSLGRPLMQISYADIQSKYVAEGEKKLQEAFDDAEEAGAILLIDELDSLAFNRAKSTREYTHTMTNQLLTCLDNFTGIFIGTTNFQSSLDPAVLRRLHLKMEFKSLEKENRKLAFKHFFGRVKPTEDLYKIPFLTPGDFHAVKNKALYTLDKPTGKDYVDLLKQEVTAKVSATPELQAKTAPKKSFGFQTN